MNKLLFRSIGVSFPLRVHARRRRQGGGALSRGSARPAGCKPSSSLFLTATRFLSRLAIFILTNRQAGYFNVLNCDSSHRPARTSAHTLRASWDCFVFSFNVTKGNFFQSKFTLIFDISETAYRLLFFTFFLKELRRS